MELCNHRRLRNISAAVTAQPTRRITIHYGDGPGRGEVTRMMLAYGNVPYEDIRYDGKDFASLTATTPEGGDPTNGSRFPFNQLPAMEIDGTIIAQTSTLARYAARLVGLYPSGLEEAAKSDEIFEHSADLQQSTTPIFMDGVPGRAGTTTRPREERTAGFLDWSKQRLPVMIRQLDNLLGTDDWFVSNQFSWADVAVFNRLENLHGLASAYGVDVLGKYAKMAAHSARVAAVPGIKAYLDERQRFMEENGQGGKSSGTYGGAMHIRVTGGSDAAGQPVCHIEKLAA